MASRPRRPRIAPPRPPARSHADDGAAAARSTGRIRRRAHRRYGLRRTARAAGFRAASCPSSSARARRAARACSLQMLAAATARGELVALVDALDMFDVESAAAAGVAARSPALDPRARRDEPGDVPRHEPARARAGDPGARRSSCRPAISGWSSFDAAEAPADACAGCRSRPGCGCSGCVEGSQTAACWSAPSRWRAARRGSRCDSGMAGSEGIGTRDESGIGIRGSAGRFRTCCSKGSISTRASSARGRANASATTRAWRSARRDRTAMADRCRCPASIRIASPRPLQPRSRLSLSPIRPADPWTRALAALAERRSSDVAAARSSRSREEFSPRYERHRDDLVTIDVSGLDRLLGPPRADRRGAAARGGGARLRVQVAVAAHAHGGARARARAARAHGRRRRRRGGRARAASDRHPRKMPTTIERRARRARRAARSRELCGLGGLCVQTVGRANARRARGAAGGRSGRRGSGAGAGVAGDRARRGHRGRWCRRCPRSASSRRSSSSGRSRGSSRCRSC